MNRPSRFIHWGLALTATALAASAVAQPAPNGWRGEAPQRYAQYHPRHGEPDLSQALREQRRHDEETYRRAEAWRERQGGPYGHGPRWERGQRYHGPVSVVRDYRHYRLRQPPRGYHWVRADDGDLLLVGTRSGQILEVVRR